jgi:UDP-N-acetylmuramate: L-alanyl-gamma-D-glutamyl-meso-diaminopimelate ligase
VLPGFKGVKKRQEVAGEFDGILVLEDFAHHPTAVGVTLAAVRQAYPTRRLVAAFEPRTNTSRRKIFQEPYAAAFKDADLILLREPPDLWKVEPEEQFSSRQLVADLKARGQAALYFPDTDQLFTGLLQYLRPNDVVLVMSNGDFNHLVRRLCEALGGNRAPAPLGDAHKL